MIVVLRVMQYLLISGKMPFQIFKSGTITQDRDIITHLKKHDSDYSLKKPIKFGTGIVTIRLWNIRIISILNNAFFSDLFFLYVYCKTK